MNMKKFLVSLSILHCFIFECKATKISLPPANEIEVAPSGIRHKWSSLSAPIPKDLFAEDPGVQGPFGIGIESNQMLVEYSALFKESPEGEVFNNPQRISF